MSEKNQFCECNTVQFFLERDQKNSIEKQRIKFNFVSYTISWNCRRAYAHTPLMFTFYICERNMWSIVNVIRNKNKSYCIRILTYFIFICSSTHARICIYTEKDTLIGKHNKGNRRERKRTNKLTNKKRIRAKTKTNRHHLSFCVEHKRGRIWIKSQHQLYGNAYCYVSLA